MTPETHPIDQEHVMAYLDGELPPDEAARVAKHLDQCASCAELAVELRRVSSRMLAWNVEPAPQRLSDAVLEELNKTGRASGPAPKKPRPRLMSSWDQLARARWAWAGVGAVALVAVVFAFGWRRSSFQQAVASKEAAVYMPDSREAKLRSRISSAMENYNNSDQLANRYDVTVEPGPPAGPPPPSPIEAPAQPAGPMIARTATLTVTAKDFDAARASMDRIVKAHQGYVSSINVSAEQGAARSFDAKLAVPAAQFEATLAELRALGRLTQEQQSSEEVTSQIVDLDARLKNARETEAQLAEILRARTGKVSDVLEVEKEMARVREEIEVMEADQKHLHDRVAFASIELNLSDEYQAQLGDAPLSVGRRIRNALVDGYRLAADGLLGICVFLLNVGPTILLWALILFWPLRWGWRRWRDSRAQGTAGA